MPKPTSPRPRRRLAPIFAALSISVLVAACGGDDDASGDTASAATRPAANAPLVVLAEDIDFPHDEYRVDAGTVDIVYENEGRIVHTLVIDDVDGFKLSVRSRGDVDEGSVDLGPGTYDLYCDVPGHRRAGMEARLVVS